MSSNDTVCLRIRRNTKERLAKIGILTANFDSVIAEMLEHVERCDRFWVDRN